MWCYALSMAPHFESPSQGNIDYLLSAGWTPDEISIYIPQIEALSDRALLILHHLCHISMFSTYETIDREQAIRVLINPKDTPKELLLSSLPKLQQMART